MSISPRGQSVAVALAGFEPARTHAKRPIGKRASHAQPPGHATVHPQPWSQPTPSCRGSRSWVPLSRFRFHVFPVSCLLLHRAIPTVPPSGIEPAPSGLQPDAQTTYARGAKRSPWESNPPGSVGQTDRLTRGVGEQMLGVMDRNRTDISRFTAARSDL